MKQVILNQFRFGPMTQSLAEELPSGAKSFHKLALLSMRLCHPPDGSTSPKYKLLCFKPP
jgi:hypothetical protein